MDKNQFNNFLRNLAEAWSRRDYVAAATLFAEDIQYADPVRYSIEGKESLRKFFEADDGREQRTAWHTVIFDEERQIGAAEYTYEGTHRYHGVVLIRVENDLITRWREYQHIDDREWDMFAGFTKWE